MSQRHTGANFPDLVALMQRLLAAGGCPWDREQTLETLLPFLVEETYEVVEAVEDGDPEHHREELGDLLFQIVFQAELRSAEGHFGIEDVVAAVVDKMTRRHPHVFADGTAGDANEVLAHWRRLKAAEHVARGKPRGTLDGIPRGVPALLQAERIGEKAAQVGFDWPDVAGVRDKLREEVAELDEAIASGDKAHVFEEIGDVLFTMTRLANKLGVAPEDALRACMDRFRARFAHMEGRATERGGTLKDLGLDEMDALWRAAKQHLATRPAYLPVTAFQPIDEAAAAGPLAPAVRPDDAGNNPVRSG